jgi:hypothetical protein
MLLVNYTARCAVSVPNSALAVACSFLKLWSGCSLVCVEDAAEGTLSPHHRVDRTTTPGIVVGPLDRVSAWSCGYTGHQVARADAVDDSTWLLLKFVSQLRLTYQIRLLASGAEQSGGRLVTRVPKGYRLSAPLR